MASRSSAQFLSVGQTEKQGVQMQNSEHSTSQAMHCVCRSANFHKNTQID